MSIFIKLLWSFFILYSVYQLGSLAGLFSERSGTANIAIEGNMIVGATLFSIFWSLFNGSIENSSIAIIFSIFFTIVISSTYMLLLGYITSKYMADHIIVGTGMNMLAPAIGLLLYGLIIKNQPSISPTYGDWIGYINGSIQYNMLFVYFFIATILILILSAFVLNKTKFGLRLKSSGENPYALETAGVSVFKTRMIALWIAGALSTFAGIAFAVKGTFNFTVNGSGFLSIGILLLGQYRVSGTIIGSAIFALFISFFNNWAIIIPGEANLQFLMNVIPFVIPIIGLMIFKTHSAPKAVGTNFKKDQR